MNVELHSIISYNGAGGTACSERAGGLGFGEGSWIIKFSGFLTFNASYRHICGTTISVRFSTRCNLGTHVPLLCYQWYWE